MFRTFLLNYVIYELFLYVLGEVNDTANRFQPSMCWWTQTEDFMTSCISVFCLFVQLPTDPFDLIFFSCILMHNLLVNEMTRSEGILGSG